MATRTKRPSFLSSKSVQLESLKNIFESLAFIIAAIWAILVFVVREAPSLKGTAKMTNEISVDSITPSKIHIEFHGTIKNNSKSTFQIDSPVVVKLWIIPLNDIMKDHHVVWEDYMDRPATDSLSTSAFISSYSPDNEVQEGFDFFVDKDPKSAVLIALNSNFSVKKHWWEFWKWLSKNEEWRDYTFGAKNQCVPDKK